MSSNAGPTRKSSILFHGKEGELRFKGRHGSPAPLSRAALQGVELDSQEAGGPTSSPSPQCQ